MNPREHVNAVLVIIDEEISAKEEKKKSLCGSTEEDEGVAEESGKTRMTSAPSEQKVLFLDALV